MYIDRECEHSFIIQSGFKVCSKCGFCQCRYIDNSSYQPYRNRSGDRINREFNYRWKMLIGSMIGEGGKSRDNFLWKRLRKAHKTFDNGSYYYFKYLPIAHEIVSILDLPRTVTLSAIHLFRKGVRELSIINGFVFMSYCILSAARQLGVPLDISNLIGVCNDLGHRVNRHLLIRSRLRYDDKLSINSCKGYTSYKDYLSKFISIISNMEEELMWRIERYTPFTSFYGFFKELTAVIMEIIDKMGDIFDVWNYKPQNLAGAIIYFAQTIVQVREDINPRKVFVFTQRLLAEALEVKEYSIRDIYVKRFTQYIYR